MGPNETVTVNGVKLTRAQVEQAMAELNPPKRKFLPGDLVRDKHPVSCGDISGSARYIVAGEALTRVSKEEYRSVIRDTDLVVVGLQNGEIYNGSPDTYEHVR